MVHQYIIFKVLTRTSNKGFTIIELLVGLIITVLVGGLAMDAIIRSGSMFANDKRDIDNGQNLSAILEMITSSYSIEKKSFQTQGYFF